MCWFLQGWPFTSGSYKTRRRTTPPCVLHRVRPLSPPPPPSQRWKLCTEGSTSKKKRILFSHPADTGRACFLKKGPFWLVEGENWLAEQLIRLVDRDVFENLHWQHLIQELLFSTQLCCACQTNPFKLYGWMDRTKLQCLETHICLIPYFWDLFSYASSSTLHPRQ